MRLLLHHREGRTLFEPRDVTLVSPDGDRSVVRLHARSGAGKRVLARIAGVDTPEAAEALRGYHVVVDRSVLAPLPDGEYYLHDLLELPVFDASGRTLGTLADVVAGDKDIWVIDTPDGEAFVIASPENVLEVDVPGRRIVLADGAIDV